MQKVPLVQVILVYNSLVVEKEISIQANENYSTYDSSSSTPLPWSKCETFYLPDDADFNVARRDLTIESFF